MFKSILLVDDDDTTNFINEVLISKLGIAQQVYVAKNGYKGIDLLGKLRYEGHECPEVIFLDLNMPGSDGFDFLEKFQATEIQRKQNCQITVLTSSNHPKDMEKLKELGITDILQKPLTTEALEKMYNRFFSPPG